MAQLIIFLGIYDLICIAAGVVLFISMLWLKYIVNKNAINNKRSNHGQRKHQTIKTICILVFSFNAFINF